MCWSLDFFDEYIYDSCFLGLISNSTIFQSFWDGFLGLTSSKQWGNVTCSRPQRTATQPGLELGTPRPVVHTPNHCPSPTPYMAHDCVYGEKKINRKYSVNIF